MVKSVTRVYGVWRLSSSGGENHGHSETKPIGRVELLEQQTRLGKKTIVNKHQRLPLKSLDITAKY